MKKLTSIIFLSLLYLLVSGCGGGNSPGDYIPRGGGGDGDPDTSKVGSVTLASPNSALVALGSDPQTSSSVGLLRITVKDIDGAPLPSQPVTFSTTGGSISPSTGNITNENGELQVSFTAPKNLGPVTITASSGLVRSNEVTINITPGPPVNIKLYAPSEIGPSDTADIIARVTDGNGYWVSAGIAVTGEVSTNNSGAINEFLGISHTDVYGQAKLTYTAGSLSGVTDTIKVEAGNVTENVGIEILQFISQVGSVSLTSPNNTLVASGSDSQAASSTGILRVTVKDTKGALFPLQPVTFTTTGGSISSDIDHITNQNGELQVLYTAPANLGPVTITAYAGMVRSNDITINIIPGPPANIKLYAPTEVGPSETAEIIARVTDSNGYPVSAGVSISGEISSNNSGSMNEFLGISNTDVYGLASLEYTAGSLTGVTDTVEIRAGNITGYVDFDVVEHISQVGTVTLTSPNNTLVALGSDAQDSYSTGILRISVKDTDGKPLPSQPVTFTTTGGSVSPETGTTNQNGELQVLYTAPSSLGPVRITASSGMVSSNDITINIIAGSPANIELFAVPIEVGPSESAEIIAIVTDGNDYPAQTTISGKISVNNSYAMNPYLGFATTDANGQAKLTYRAGSLAGIDTVEVKTGNGVEGYIDIEVIPAADTDFDAKATVQVLPADGVSASTLEATVTDGGKPVAGIPVYFSVDKNAVLDEQTVLTDANGRAAAKVTDGAAENVTARISLSSNNYVDIPLYFGANIMLDPKTSKATGNGTDTVTLTARVRDAGGAAVPNVPVDFRVSAGSGALLAQSSVLTDNNGQANNSVIGTVVEEATIEATAGLVGPAVAKIDFLPGEPAAITLSSLPAAPVSLSIYGSASITAKVTDGVGNPVRDNTLVEFSTNLGDITSEALTADGAATVEFSALQASGNATITVTSGGALETMIIEIKPSGEVGTIMTESVDPESRTIHIAGTEGNRMATIKFRVRDSAGNSVADGTEILVYIDPTTIGGGEALSAGGEYSQWVIAETTNGIATVSLRSGTVAGIVDVVAAYDPDGSTDPASFDGDEIATIARITMVGGMPDARHFGLAATTLNLAGGLEDGLPSTITATLGDRFGNVVLDGTQVSFTSECGLVGESVGFTSTTQQGKATAVFRTTEPRLSDGNLLDGPPGGPFSIRNGLCRIVAYTQGAESFQDINGNGVYDHGIDTCIRDLPEPFIDENDNGVWDPGELYIDVNENGIFDGADGVCQQNTVIWTSMNLLITGGIGPFNLRKYGLLPEDGLDFTLAVGESQSFLVDFQDEYIQDLNGNGVYDIGIDYGNIPVAGTALEITKEGGGKLLGTTGHVQADSTGIGVSFPFTVMSDIKEDAEPEVVEITVTIKASDEMLTDSVTGNSKGNNNGATVIQKFAGVINMPPSLPEPRVILTSPTDGQYGVDTDAEVVIVFNNNMDGYTVIPANVTMRNITDGDDHALEIGTDLKNQKVYTFTPGPELLPGKVYQVTVSAAVEDRSGTPLTGDYVFTFETAP